MKKILFPTDFSHNANSALEFAVEIASLTRSSLELIHVYTPMVSKGNMMSALLADEVGNAAQEAKEKLKIMCGTIGKEYPNVRCQYHVRVGTTINEIINACTDYNCDLIIMGTLGANKLSKMLFGTNTAEIIEHSEIPVLAIPSGCSYRPLKRILFATNFSFNDLQGIKKLAVIAAAFKSEIIIGHVDISNDEDRYDEHPTMANFMKEVKAISDYPLISSEIVNDHNVSMGLDKIIDEFEIDLFAISTHRRTWFEKISNPSLTQKISNYTDIPLLAFHNPVMEVQDVGDF